MGYFSLACVERAYNAISKETKDKFWGILAILYSIDKTIVPNTGYSIDTTKLSSFLEDTFRFSDRKTYDNSSSYYSVIFSSKWVEKISQHFVVGSPSVLPVIVWAYRKEHFTKDVSARELFERFLNDFHISQEVANELFSINLESFVLEFNDSLYDDLSLLKSIKGADFDHNKTTLKTNGEVVVANPGELSRGPFFQPLYASLNTLECLTIYPFDVKEYYSSSKEEPVFNTSFVPTKALQQIYFGAPGTGKSFKIDSNENITEQNSVRTTFHPDSDYSTFVGCYKPVKRVTANKFSDISLKEFITMAGEITGRPAGDKVGLIIDFVTKYAERLCQLVEEDESIKSLNYLLWNVLGFSNETYLAKVIEKTIEERAANAEITYDFVPQAFTTAYIEAWKNLASPYYLIIEEINRGNCAQIFGDIFQLLDRDSKTGVSSYKITPDKDLQNYIAEQLKGCNIDTDIKTGAKMQLPSNLSILATMNTSDQSLFPIDSAFKRRWEWKYIPINYNDNKSVIVCGADRFSWNEFLSVVNQKIESVTQSEDKKLGAWFVKAEAGEISAEKFVSKVIFYLWNDIFKDFAHDGNSIFKEDYNKFHKFFDFTGEVDLMVLDKFLRSLGLTPTPTSGDDADDFEADYDDTISTNGKSNDNSLFSINGNGHYNKGEVAFEAVKMFANSHTDLSAQEVAKTWTTLNIPVSNLVLTEEQYADKKSRSKENMQKFEKRFNMLNLSDSSIVYISKGFTIDTIMQFARIVNNKSEWGIHIDRVAQ